MGFISALLTISCLRAVRTLSREPIIFTSNPWTSPGSNILNVILTGVTVLVSGQQNMWKIKY